MNDKCTNCGTELKDTSKFQKIFEKNPVNFYCIDCVNGKGFYKKYGQETLLLKKRRYGKMSK